MANHETRDSRDSIFKLQYPWDQNSNSVWLASTITINRNIEKFKFPAKLPSDRHKQVVALVSKELIAMDLLDRPQLFHPEALTPLQNEFLVEHFLTEPGFYQSHSGEAFVVNKKGDFLAALNMRDHIQLQMLDCKGELEETWTRLVAIETQLGKHAAYAFSPRFGFLTADYNRCGTALSVSAFLQVPGLVHAEKIDEVLDKDIDDSLSVMGIQGSPTEIIGDIIVVQNNYSLGVTEENIISSIRTFITKIIVEEKSIRRKIVEGSNNEIKDKVSRAFGILMHSYQLEVIEVLNALSLLKLGLELNWVVGITIQEINKLFFNCRRAHLLQNCGGDKIKPEEIPHKRAEFIHSNLKNVKLAI